MPGQGLINTMAALFEMALPGSASLRDQSQSVAPPPKFGIVF